MAISMNYNKEAYGQTLQFERAYIKIDSLVGSKERVDLNINVLDEEQVNVIDYLRCSFVPDVSDNSENFIKQGYEYMKTLNEFKNGVDC